MKKTYLYSFCARCLTLLVLALLSTNLAWGEYTSVYSTGFEKCSTGTNYQGTQSYDSEKGDGASWTIYYGTVSTSDKISGNQSAQIRLYSNKNAGYLLQTSDIKNVDKFEFKYAVSNNVVTFDVLYSTDSGNKWTTAESVTPSTITATTFSYELPSKAETFRLKILVTGGFPISKNYTFRIDDINYYNAGVVGTKHNVSFDANGGDGTMDDVSLYEGNYTLPECDFTKAGYEFIGWKVNNEGEIIEAGKTYNITSDVKFYAQWKESSNITLSFNFKEHPTGWPTAKSSSKEGYLTYNLNNIDYVFHASKSGDGIYMGGTSVTSGYLMVPSGDKFGLPIIYGYKLVKVVGKLNDSGTPSTSSEVSITDGTNALTGGAKQTWSTKGNEYTYSLSSTAANTMYYLSVSNKNCQIINLKLTYEKISQVDVSITDAKWATLGLPYAVTIPKGVSAYTATISDKTVTLSKINKSAGGSNVIPANCGVILYAEAAGTYTFYGTTTEESYKDNKLVAVISGPYICTGNDIEKVYYIGLQNNRPMFKMLIENGNIAAGKAYLKLDEALADGAKLEISFADEPTGIQNINPILSEGSKIYNLNGMKVNNSYKGIVIMNGKKYINK